MIVRGLKIDRIREAFSKVKQDITELKSKLNEFQTKLEDNALRIDERLDKEEFYNFVKEQDKVWKAVLKLGGYIH